MAGMDMLLNQLIKSIGLDPVEIKAKVETISDNVATFGQRQDHIVELLEQVFKQNTVILLALQLNGMIKPEDNPNGGTQESGGGTGAVKP